MDKELAFDFDEEFSRAGLLFMFWNRVHKGESIDMQTVQREVVFKNCVGLILTVLGEQASEATINQMDGAYVHIKL